MSGPVERTPEERERALVQRQLARQAHVRRKPRRKFGFQFALAGLLVALAIAAYATDLFGWANYVVIVACVLAAGAALA